MISKDSVEQSIMELEGKDTTFATCERLAWLYIVRDHLAAYDVPLETKINVDASSAFLDAINGKNPASVWPVVDELVEAVKVLHPQMYGKFIDKLKDK